MMEALVEEEQWVSIPNFSNYLISNLGQVYNLSRDSIMRTSFTPFGHMKISLVADDGKRYDRSVAQLVAEAFVEPPTILCDHVVVLDGDFSNVAAYNLMWRPQWFVWKYTRQLKVPQPLHYHNLPVRNLVTGATYPNIIEAGVSEGLLFLDIWRSTYTSAVLFPNSSIFEIIR